MIILVSLSAQTTYKHSFTHKHTQCKTLRTWIDQKHQIKHAKNLAPLYIKQPRTAFHNQPQRSNKPQNTFTDLQCKLQKPRRNFWVNGRTTAVNHNRVEDNRMGGEKMFLL